MEVAASLLEFGRYYLYAGAGVAILFLVIGIDRVDPSARGSYVFRPLLIPGICLIWPLVLHRWWTLERASKDPGEAGS